MSDGQVLFLSVYLVVNALIFIKSVEHSVKKNNAYGLTNWAIPLGIFVWGDGLVWGLFWVGSVLASLYLKSWVFFWLVVSLFWVVRGLGETIFWLNHQHSSKTLYPAKDLPFYNLVKNESIWFIYQIAAQAVTVVAILFSLYFGKLWLGSF